MTQKKKKNPNSTHNTPHPPGGGCCCSTPRLCLRAMCLCGVSSGPAAPFWHGTSINSENFPQHSYLVTFFHTLQWKQQLPKVNISSLETGENTIFSNLSQVYNILNGSAPPPLHDFVLLRLENSAKSTRIFQGGLDCTLQSHCLLGAQLSLRKPQLSGIRSAVAPSAAEKSAKSDWNLQPLTLYFTHFA